MVKGFLLIDGNNLGHIANNTTKLKVGEFETQAIFGIIRAVRSIMMTYPMLKPVVLWDGITWRRDIYPEYKANREKEAVSKHEVLQTANRVSYRAQKPLINKSLEVLGVTQMAAMNMEADDLAGMITRKAERESRRVLMISGDKDWIQLVSPTTSWFDPVNNVKITSATIEEKLGVKTPRSWLEVKALMGDAGDNIPGVGGIGQKGAVELLNTYGSVSSFINGTIDGTITVSSLVKKFRDFAEDDSRQDAWCRNMRLMDLRAAEIPAPLGLKTTKGKLNREAFEKICKRLLFKSFLTDYTDWLEPFREKI